MRPETRKQIEPRASGRQTSGSYPAAVAGVSSALKVVTLKNSVPADWTIAAHHAADPPAWWRCPKANALCRAPPSVNRIEPAKKVSASARAPTRSRYPGKGATTKHAEPAAKHAAIQRSRVIARAREPQPAAGAGAG